VFDVLRLTCDKRDTLHATNKTETGTPIEQWYLACSVAVGALYGLTARKATVAAMCAVRHSCLCTSFNNKIKETTERKKGNAQSNAAANPLRPPKIYVKQM